ncbi:MAG: hypothetical protein ACYCSF_11780 [Acidimicrobiales bacterium]
MALPDHRPGALGTSRSALVREAIEAYLVAEASGGVDAAIVSGYERVPPEELGREVMALAAAFIDAERGEPRRGLVGGIAEREEAPLPGSHPARGAPGVACRARCASDPERA